MKRYLTYLLCLLAMTIGLNGYAQEDTIVFKEKEFGFNCTPLISSILPFESNPVFNPNDFVLVYKKHRSSGWYSRFGGAIILGDFDDIDIDTGTILLKYGTEKKLPLTKSWVFHAGSEVFAGVSTPSTFNFRGELGVSGLYGIQWKINDRIGLGTEGYLVLSILNEERTGSDANGFNVKFLQPRSLLFSIYF